MLTSPTEWPMWAPAVTVAAVYMLVVPYWGNIKSHGGFIVELWRLHMILQFQPLKAADIYTVPATQNSCSQPEALLVASRLGSSFLTFSHWHFKTMKLSCLDSRCKRRPLKLSDVLTPCPLPSAVTHGKQWCHEEGERPSGRAVDCTFALVARLLRLRRAEESIWRASVGLLFFLLQLMVTKKQRERFRGWIEPVGLVVLCLCCVLSWNSVHLTCLYIYTVQPCKNKKTHLLYCTLQNETVNINWQNNNRVKPQWNKKVCLRIGWAIVTVLKVTNISSALTSYKSKWCLHFISVIMT